jgi:competence protein ComEA
MISQISNAVTLSAPEVSQESKANKTQVIKSEINLNQSTLEQLVTLKGVGDKKAHAIINYRKQQGKFKSVKDLLNVKGIGVKILEDNQSRLRI